MMEIQFDMELDTPLGGGSEYVAATYSLGIDGKRDKEKRRKKKDGEENGELASHVDDTNAKTDYPSPNSLLSTSHSATTSRSPGRSPKAFRSSLPHTLTLEAERQPTKVVQQPSPHLEAASYQHLKMRYMRSLNFAPEELKALRMKGRDRSQTITLPLGQSMPIPVAGGPFGSGPGGGFAASVADADDDGVFIPPHELVRHDDTFSVWHYEQKKIASKEAV